MSRQPADSDVPSWDEFNVEEQVELDYDESMAENLEECGPSLPPGFANDDSQDCKPSSSSFISGFSTQNDEEPEDPEPINRASSYQRYTEQPHIPNEIDGDTAAQQDNNINVASNSQTSEHFSLPSFTLDPCSSSTLITQTVIGPSLPPGFLEAKQKITEDIDLMAPPDEPGRRSMSPKYTTTSSTSIGPTLPSEFLPTVSQAPKAKATAASNMAVIGPTLPPGFLCDSTRSSDDEELIDEPSTSAKSGEQSLSLKPTNKSFTPEFDEGPCTSSKASSIRLSNNTAMDLPDEEGSHNAPNGNGINGYKAVEQNEIDDDEDDELIGPALPPENSALVEEQYIHRLMEIEAQKSQGSGLKREEWMTELPQKLKQSYGLSAKSTFNRSSGGPSSSSAWTASPGDALKSKPKEKETAKRTAKDVLQEQIASHLNEDRQESLLAIHQKKRKIEPENNGTATGSNERKPFNRDTDMEVRGLSNLNGEEAKARLGSLSSRFGSSSSNKFL